MLTMNDVDCQPYVITDSYCIVYVFLSPAVVVVTVVVTLYMGTKVKKGKNLNW